MEEKILNSKKVRSLALDKPPLQANLLKAIKAYRYSILPASTRTKLLSSHHLKVVPKPLNFFSHLFFFISFACYSWSKMLGILLLKPRKTLYKHTNSFFSTICNPKISKSSAEPDGSDSCGRLIKGRVNKKDELGSCIMCSIRRCQSWGYSLGKPYVSQGKFLKPCTLLHPLR